MSLRYSYQLHNARQHPPCVHLLQELQEEVEEEAEAVEAEAVEAEAVEAEAVEAEAEVEEVEVEAEEADQQTPLTSDSAETLPRYSQEKERKQTASSPNSNATT